MSTRSDSSGGEVIVIGCLLWINLNFFSGRTSMKWVARSVVGPATRVIYFAFSGIEAADEKAPRSFRRPDVDVCLFRVERRREERPISCDGLRS